MLRNGVETTRWSCLGAEECWLLDQVENALGELACYGEADSRYDYSPAVILVGEIDGLRIVSSTTCDFVQKVADSTLAVFRPGSTHPAAILFDALDQFDRKSPKADESIRTIRPDLASAVDTCIEAAGREPDVHWQRRLLKVRLLSERQ